MKRIVAEEIERDPEKYAHHDRVFLNNPVVMQGMGLAPLVVLATNGQNALMLAAAVALLLTPSRMLACLVSRLFPLSEHPSTEELQKRLLPRSLIYCGCVALLYVPVYYVLNAAFGVGLLTLGIYLPMLAVEPLLIYRFGRVQERMGKAVSKGLRITLGYVLLLLLLGCLRELLAQGTVFGNTVISHALLPMASMPAGGFIVLGVLCAAWRALAKQRKDYLKTEARNIVYLNRQKEAKFEQ